MLSLMKSINHPFEVSKYILNLASIISAICALIQSQIC